MSTRTLRAAILDAHARITDKTAMHSLLEPLPPSIAAHVRKLANNVEIAAELWGAIMRAAPIGAERLSAIYAEVTGHTVEAIGTVN
jgi:hypothetical protein